MLYEVITGNFGFFTGADTMQKLNAKMYSEAKRRITSYNVCYTKLLRALTARTTRAKDGYRRGSLKS